MSNQEFLTVAESSDAGEGEGSSTVAESDDDDDDDSGEGGEGSSFERFVQERGVDLSALKQWFEYVPIPRCTSMLEGLPTVATTMTLHFLGLNDLGVAMAVSRGWSGFVCSNVLAHLPRSVWFAAAARINCYGRAKFVNPFTVGNKVLKCLGRRLLKNESVRGPGDVRGDVKNLPSHLSMLAYAILPEARGGSDCSSSCSQRRRKRRRCTCWINTVREVPPDPVSDMLLPGGESSENQRLWPCPACGSGYLRYFEPTMDDDLDITVSYYLHCDRCAFALGRRRLCQCPRCHQWASAKTFTNCIRCNRSLCCEFWDEDTIGPYEDHRPKCIRPPYRNDVCQDCADIFDLPACIRCELLAQMGGDDY